MLPCRHALRVDCEIPPQDRQRHQAEDLRRGSQRDYEGDTGVTSPATITNTSVSHHSSILFIKIASSSGQKLSLTMFLTNTKEGVVSALKNQQLKRQNRQTNKEERNNTRGKQQNVVVIGCILIMPASCSTSEFIPIAENVLHCRMSFDLFSFQCENLFLAMIPPLFTAELILTALVKLFVPFILLFNLLFEVSEGINFFSLTLEASGDIQLNWMFIKSLQKLLNFFLLYCRFHIYWRSCASNVNSHAIHCTFDGKF